MIFVHIVLHATCISKALSCGTC